MRRFAAVVLVLLYIGTAAAQMTEWDAVQPVHVAAAVAYTRYHGPTETTAHSSGGRIVGGKEVSPHSIPHQVALLITSPDGQLFCGGSLISRDYVLTAAHCAEPGTSFTVILGAHRVREEEDTQVRVNTTHKCVHPAWNAITTENDIALIRLPEHIEYTAEIQPVRLPTSADGQLKYVGVDATMSGWGKPADRATGISTELRAVTKPVIDNTLCNLTYLGAVRDTNICTSGSGGQSTCNGDSGGPLTVALHGDVRPTLVGLVSFGVRLGCEVNWPPVFTRVAAYTDWITMETGIHPH